MTRKLLIAGGILAVILVVAVKFLGSNLDAIVKKAITRIGPEMTGVSVDVDKVGIALADGRGEIGGLVIGNPRGYKGPHAFKLGSIVLALDKSSDTADVVVIKELTIDAPDIVYDKSEDGSNVEAIQRNIDEYGKTHFDGQEKNEGGQGRCRRQALHHRVAADPQRQATAHRQRHRDGPADGAVAQRRQEPGRHDRR